jgi:WXXGXW repeat (2 copies)
MKTFLKLALFGGLLAIAIPASAQLHIGVGINIGPPAPRAERMSARPSRDAVWIAGYHRWAPRRHRYVWVPGRWMRPPRPHTVWVAGRWERRNNEWVYYEGRWENEPLRVR